MRLEINKIRNTCTSYEYDKHATDSIIFINNSIYKSIKNNVIICIMIALYILWSL